MPRVDTHIVASGNAPGGVGEIGVAAVIPAFCNAVFAATGAPVRSLPLFPGLPRRADLPG